jgi:hypothetical protein
MKLFKIILLALATMLIIFRLCLPSILLKYIEHQINKIPEYHVQIGDLDVALYRGSYTLKHIQLWRITKNIPVPYFESETIDFSVEWSALLKGKFVAKITLQKPTVNFVIDPTGSNEQLTINAQWLDIVKTLFPLNINRLDVHNGEVYFRSFHGKPPFKTYIKDVEFTIHNMQNANRISTLQPSQFEFSGQPMGGGSMNVVGKFNPFDKRPNFYFKGALVNLNVAQISNLLKHYTDIDVTGGTFSLYGEAGAEKDELKGYAKPFFKNLKIGNPKKESPIGVIYNGIAAVAAKIVENPQKKTIATKINIEGRIDDPNTSILSIIGYLLHHAFIQALLPQVDNSIEMQNIIYNHTKTDSKKFPSYRN